MSDADPDGETNHHIITYRTHKGMVCLSIRTAGYAFLRLKTGTKREKERDFIGFYCW